MGRRFRALLLFSLALVATLLLLRTRILNALLFQPSAEISQTPAAAGLAFEELEIATEDAERLNAWWVKASRQPSLGHLLYCHGNGGNLGTRVAKCKLLADAGFDILVFDYRGYGKSTGHPTEEGTYRDARAARKALLARAGVEASRLFYVGESLGGAVALALAIEEPPRGLVLQSTFTSVRDEARIHYAHVPTFIIPDAYPSLRRITALRCPLLIVHGESDDVVPVSHAHELYAAAPEPKTLRLFPGASHNDFVVKAGASYASLLASWVGSLH